MRILLNSDWDEGGGGAEEAKPQVQQPAAAPVTAAAGSQPAKPAASDSGLPTFDETFVKGAKEPKDSKKLREILKVTSALRTRGKAQQEEKQRREKLVREAINRVEQGAAHVHIDANAQAIAQKKHPEIARRQRIEFEARTNPDIKELLAESAADKATIDTLLKRNADLAAKVETLSKPKQ